VSSVHGKPLLQLGFLHFALVFQITLAGGTMFFGPVIVPPSKLNLERPNHLEPSARHPRIQS
jgi:hypothetical protein